jgi:hypothetical protein
MLINKIVNKSHQYTGDMNVTKKIAKDKIWKYLLLHKNRIKVKKDNFPSIIKQIYLYYLKEKTM